MNSGRYFRFFAKVAFLATCLSTKAQELTSGPNSNFGVYGGLHMGIGTHIQRLGLNIGFFIYQGQIQSNTEVKVYWNLKNLGPSLPHKELVLSQGLVFSYGIKNKAESPFFGIVSNQTGYNYSLAYAYNAYFNSIRSGQQTGILALQFEDLFLITENDLLAKASLDRFRTGAFLCMYQYQNSYQFALNCSMWSGQMGPGQIRNRDGFPARCYMDSSGGVYTNYSHGLLSVQFKAALPYRQQVQVNAGVDAEKVRNFVQNKIMHDMIFLPEKWRPKNNCHIPMICNDGSPYLYEKNQQLRDPQLYLNLFVNPSCFY